jgi:putative acetyltransferase
MAGDEFDIRKSATADAPAIAVISRDARKRALPYLPDLHTPDQDLAFFRDVVLNECGVWVSVLGNGTVVGFCALREGWIEHLYIAPAHQGRGLGSRLLRHAMLGQSSLRLWTFQRNALARRFYEKHGFLAVNETDGARNEEKEPDVLYAWSRPDENERNIRPSAYGI